MKVSVIYFLTNIVKRKRRTYIVSVVSEIYTPSGHELKKKFLGCVEMLLADQFLYISIFQHKLYILFLLKKTFLYENLEMIYM